MSRRKKAEDSWMPPRVYLKGPSFFFHPKGGGSILLCKATESKSQVWVKYEQLMNEWCAVYRVKKMIHEFFGSAEFAHLSKNTRKDYEKNSRSIMLVFGNMGADSVKPPHVRAYMDRRGLKSVVQANREKAFFSRVFSWAYERGKVKSNPCKGVRQFTEKARTKYITDEEYKIVYDAAPPAIRVAMDLSYLCVARKSDVITMRWEQVLEEGIFIQQGKTGVKQIKLWSERLIEVINMAKTLSENKARVYVVVKPDGFPYTSNGFSGAWQNTIKRARQISGLPLELTFHDIKAKAISDIDGSASLKQSVSGHKTQSQIAVYDRSVKRVPTVDALKEK